VAQVLDVFWGPVVLRLIAEVSELVWQIVDCLAQLENPRFVIDAVRTVYPAAEVSVRRYEHSQFAAPFFRLTVPYTLAGDGFAPLKYVTELRSSDPLGLLVSALSAGLRVGERSIFTLYVGNAAGPATAQAEVRKIQQPNINPFQLLSVRGWMDASLKVATGHAWTAKYARDAAPEGLVFPDAAPGVSHCPDHGIISLAFGVSPTLTR
jgi:hypothetical protein